MSHQTSSKYISITNNLILSFLSKFDVDVSIRSIWMEDDQQAILKAAFSEELKKDKPKKDKDAPKRGKTAYQFFALETREANKDRPWEEVKKIISDSWTALKNSTTDDDLETMARLTMLSLGDKQRYAEDMESYIPPAVDENQPAVAKKRAAKRAAKDPNAPKGVRSSYIYFCQYMRPILKDRGVDSKDMMAELGEAWRALSDDEKAPYIEMSKNDRDRYANEMTRFTPDDSPVDSPDGSPVEKKARAPRKPKDPNAPKRAKSAYLFFCQEKRPILKGQGIESKEMMSALGVAWATLKASEDPEHKEQLSRYNAMALADKEDKAQSPVSPPEEDSEVVPIARVVKVVEEVVPIAREVAIAQVVEEDTVEEEFDLGGEEEEQKESESDGLDELNITALKKLCVLKRIKGYSKIKTADELRAHMRKAAESAE
jgi:hypothetical protein